MNLDHVRVKVRAREVEWNSAKARLRQEKVERERVTQQLQDVAEAQVLLQTVVQQIQNQAHNRIASVVSRSLEAVFDEPYEFKINFEQKRGRTEAGLVFVRDGIEVDPMTASGGGVVDVAAFALRLSCLMLSKPPLSRTLVFDEPFKFVSAEYRSRLRKLLETLAEEMGVQIIQVTHIPELRVGKIVEL